MRVVIADDEAPARQFLRRLLTSHNDVEIVGEAEDGTEVIGLVATAKPDVLFLDIQMPGGNGLEVAAGLMRHRPAIVFCTAYEQHAIEAFELEAVDYLLKPVSRSRLGQALDRIRRTDPAQPVPKAHERLSRFLARRGGNFVVIPASKAAYFESVDGLTKIVAVTGEAYWMDSPKCWSSASKPRGFSRVEKCADQFERGGRGASPAGRFSGVATQRRPTVGG